MSALIDDNAVPVVTDAPAEIWLCYGDIFETQSHSNLERNHHHILWCEDKQDVSDVRYVRADTVAERIAELESEVARLRADAGRYKAALNWALGVGDDFPVRAIGQGAYYWRAELAGRAELEYNGTEYAAKEQS